VPVVIDFALVGAMKAGTTTLAARLAAHPALCVSERKEPGYFSRDERYALGAEWYASFFKHRRPGQMLGDASTCYSRSAVYPEAAPRLREHNPGLKLVYVLRHPVDRAYSHYAHEMRRLFVRGEPLPAPRAFFESDPECVAASLYAREIDHLHRWFAPEQLLVLRFEDLVASPEGAARRVFEFLGVDPDASGPGATHLNAMGEGLGARRLRRRVTRARHAPLVARAVDVLPRRVRRRAKATILSWGAAAARSIDDRFREALPALGPDDRAWLHARFDGETRELGRRLGWDVSAWLSGAGAELVRS